MVKLLGKKVARQVDYLDLLGAGAVKIVSDIALFPVIGDGNLLSGGIKLGSGILARRFLGSGFVGNSASLGLSVGGVEDLYQALFMGAAGVGARGDDW